jgi:transcriptional regulator with XRE-family HTH domain
MTSAEIAPGFATAEDWYRAACGVVFKQLREGHGWTYRQFAARAGTSHTGLYEVERGNSTPGIDLLARVAAACDLTLPALLALIVDELRAGRDADPSSLGAVTEAARELDGEQRAELARYAEWLGVRDGQ